MPLFGTRDQAEERFKEAKRYSHPSKKEFDLDTAVRLLEEALMLKPDKEQYRQKLDEIGEIKAKRDLKFSMRARSVGVVTDPGGGRGEETKRYTSVNGIIEQGTIREGDEVEIRGHRGTRRAKVEGVNTGYFPGPDFCVAGQEVCLTLQDLAENDVMPGDELEGV